jgi:hypothetical protein
VNSPPDARSLAGLQAGFSAALRARGAAADDAVRALTDCIVDDGLAPASRVQVYRNNVRAMFDGALARTYPVLKRRVGDACFRELAMQYRTDHPSRSGDLHWVGKAFASWLEVRVGGSDYAWLADLARLEWACEESLVASRLCPLDPQALARVAPETLADIGLRLQPGLRSVSSEFPIWSVWQANQGEASGNPVDPELGPQHVVIACTDDGLVLHSIPADQFRFVAQLASGAPLGEALEASGLEVERLPGVLAWLFGAGLVTGLQEPSNGSAA